MLGERIADLDLPADPMAAGHVCVKEAVLPFDRFEGADAMLGPEMRSTGEVMGIARDFPTAFAKAQAAAGAALPDGGTAFITVTDSDKPGAVAVAQTLHDLGFRIVATRGTREAIERMGIPAGEIKKIGEGSPNVVDWIERGDVDLVVNTPDRLGRAHRRLGDPPRRGRPRDPVPDDALGRPGRGAGDRGRAARRARGAVAAGGPPAGTAPRPPGRAHERRRAHARPARAPAPGGRRAARGRRLRRARGPRPRGRRRRTRASSTCSPRRALGRGTTSGRSCRGPSPCCGPPAARWSSCSRTSAPAPSAWRARPRRRLWVLGPLGAGFRPPRDGRTALLCGGGVGIAPLAIWQDALLAGGLPAPALLGFRDAAHAEGAGLLANARLATDDGSAGHHGLVTELLEAELDERPARRASTPAARPRCSRRSARCAERRGVPAQLALESGMACGFGACFGCVVPAARGRLRAPVRRRARARRGRAGRGARALSMGRVSFCGLELAHPVVNGSGTFDAIAARRAFGDALLDALPVRAFVSKTITLEPRAGNPPPRLFETPAGMVNSIGLPNRGLAGYLEHDLPELAGCRSR